MKSLLFSALVMSSLTASAATLSTSKGILNCALKGARYHVSYELRFTRSGIATVADMAAVKLTKNGVAIGEIFKDDSARFNLDEQYSIQSIDLETLGNLQD